jgi:hypothetical protein
MHTVQSDLKKDALYHPKTRLRTGGTGVQFPAKVKDISVVYNSHTVSEVQSVSNWTGTGDAFNRVKRPERETDHSLPESAEFNNEWKYSTASTHTTCRHGAQEG